MRIPLRWLADYVDLTIPTEELARRLTTAGVAVGKIISSAGEWDGVVVGEIVKVEKHPNADRLTRVTVHLGKGRPARGVCGTPKVAGGPNLGCAPEGPALS